MVLPMRTTTAPSACRASFPVSTVISRPSGSLHVLVIIVEFIVLFLMFKMLCPKLTRAFCEAGLAVTVHHLGF
jgi:hypothetical protein